jgi:hypothetical protein
MPTKSFAKCIEEAKTRLASNPTKIEAQVVCSSPVSFVMKTTLRAQHFNFDADTGKISLSLDGKAHFEHCCKMFIKRHGGYGIKYSDLRLAYSISFDESSDLFYERVVIRTKALEDEEQELLSTLDSTMAQLKRLRNDKQETNRLVQVLHKTGRHAKSTMTTVENDSVPL